jgi:hypothetical protein
MGNCCGDDNNNNYRNRKNQNVNNNIKAKEYTNNSVKESNEITNLEKNAVEIIKYSKSISKNLNQYSFDTQPKEFINKIMKENNVNEEIAKNWLSTYVDYMVILGFYYSKNVNQSIKFKEESITRNMAIPYELLQVWRLHVLYTKKYEEFCSIITSNTTNCIPFYPPKLVWKSGDPKVISEFFRLNHGLMSRIYANSKSVLNSLFIFQSAFLKNNIHYCLDYGNPIISKVREFYNKESNNQNGIFKVSNRSIESLRSFSNDLENNLFKYVLPSEPLNNHDWKVTNNVTGIELQKSYVFENANLPNNFVMNFGVDHLLSLDKANLYVKEYKKYLYLCFIQKKSFCPSEQVDLVWHYHQLYTKEYREFSKMYLNINVFGHNPSDGTKEESIKYNNMYNDTLNTLRNYFGFVNEICWPISDIRFNQVFQWYNHHYFMSQTTAWNNSENTKNVNKNVVNVYSGCYRG